MSVRVGEAPSVPALRRRRTAATDVAIVLSCAAGLAHLVTAPAHYTWWPAAGVFFVALGVAQLAFAVVLLRGVVAHRVILAGVWGTVGVVLLYVASRTVGIPMAPPVPFHGGRWAIGRSAVPNGAKHVGPLDIFTLLTELVLVISLLGMLPVRPRVRTVNRLLWLGIALWSAALVGFVW